MIDGKSSLIRGVAIMSLLDHPEALDLLDDAAVSTDDVRDCRAHLTRFLKRHLPCFRRSEQRGHLAVFIRGLLSGLERKSGEPIARQAGIPRKNLPMFVGQGAWDDGAVMAAVRREACHVPTEVVFRKSCEIAAAAKPKAPASPSVPGEL